MPKFCYSLIPPGRRRFWSYRYPLPGRAIVYRERRGRTSFILRTAEDTLQFSSRNCRDRDCWRAENLILPEGIPRSIGIGWYRQVWGYQASEGDQLDFLPKDGRLRAGTFTSRPSTWVRCGAVSDSGGTWSLDVTRWSYLARQAIALRQLGGRQLGLFFKRRLGDFCRQSPALYNGNSCPPHRRCCHARLHVELAGALEQGLVAGAFTAASDGLKVDGEH